MTVERRERPAVQDALAFPREVHAYPLLRLKALRTLSAIRRIITTHTTR
jgi:hypothetical protein